MVKKVLNTLLTVIEYFIGYKYGDKVKQLSIKPPKMSGYAKYFDESKHMNFSLNF